LEAKLGRLMEKEKGELFGLIGDSYL